jgi:hypothetical protein
MSDSRRDFVKKAMYVAPVVLTLGVAPEFAKAGSGSVKDPKVPKPPKGKPPKGKGKP